MTFNELKSTRIFGNAADDARLLHNLDMFIADETNTISDRAAAVDYIGIHVMGCDHDTRDACTIVTEYMSYR